jgi:hypothetical protein
MNCPHCHTDKSEVVDSRNWKHPHTSQEGIRRRRECKGCNVRYTTLEIIVSLAPDGSITSSSLTPTLNGNGHNGNGYKPVSKPKPQKPVTRSQREIKKQLDLAIRRARAKAVMIEDEDLLNDPDLMDDLDASEIDDFDDFDL